MNYDLPWHPKPPVGVPLDGDAPLRSGLVAFYALNEGAGKVALDGCGTLGHSLDLTATGFGSTSPWMAGNRGVGVASASGGACLVATIPAAAQLGWPMTIACAFRPSGSGGGNQRIFGLVPNNNNQAPFDALALYAFSSTVVKADLGNGSTNTALGSCTVTPGVDCVIGLTVTSKSWTLYLNGNLVTSGTGTYSTPTWAATAQVVATGYGANVGNSGCAPMYWAGWWGRALSPAEHEAIGGDVGAIWPQLYRNPVAAAVPASLVAGITGVSPSAIYANNSTAVAVTGYGTTWTPGSTTQFQLDSPPAGTSIASQSVTDATHASVTIQCGSTAGSFQLDDKSGHTSPMVVAASSFTTSPSVIPAGHAGNLTLTLTGQGTNWTSGTTFTLPSIPGLSLVSKTWRSATSVTLVVTTGSGTGTGNITDSTDIDVSSLAVATPALAITPTSAAATSTCTLTLTGTNTVWTQSSPTGLFTIAFPGATLSSIAIQSDTHATATLALAGTSGGTLTVTDTSTGAIATTTVRAVPSGSLHVTGPLLLQHTGGSTGAFGGQSTAWLAFRFKANSNAGLNLAAGTTVLSFGGGTPNNVAPVTYNPATRTLVFLLYSTGGSQPFRVNVPIQVGISYHFLLAWSNGSQVLYLNGLPYATASIAAGTYAYSGLQVGGNAGNVYGTSTPQAMDHTVADVAMGNGYVPSRSEALALANGGLSPLQLATPALTWWPLGGGTLGSNPIDSDRTAAWGWLADYTGNGNTLSVATTTPAGSLSNATYAAAVPIGSPLLISAIIDKTGKFAVFEASGATPINGVNPPATISALNATPTVHRNGSTVQLGPACWFPKMGDCPVVMYPLQCGGVQALAITDGGGGYTSPTVTPNNAGTGGSGLTLGTPLLQLGVTSYALTNAGSGYAQPPILTITDQNGSGSGALGYCVIDSGGRCAGVIITNGGANYSNPVGTISGGNGSGATVTLTQVGGVVQNNALMGNFGSGYNPPPSVTVGTPPNIKGPAGNKVAQARANVYGSDAASWGGTPGAIRAIVPLVGGLLGCGQGYSPGSPPAVTVAAPPSGTTATATAVVSSYIAAVPVTSSGAGYNKPPTFTITDSGGTPTRTAILQPIMSGATASDVFTYDAPAAWLTATLGGTGFVYSTWIQGNSVGGLQAVTGAAMTNWTGQVEGPTGGLLGFNATPTMLAGANTGALPVSSSSMSFTAKNRLHAYRAAVLRNGGTLILSADETPASWTPGSVIGWQACTSTGVNAIDGTGDPQPYGTWTACYDDPYVNTAGATAAYMSTFQDSGNLVITPVMLSGPASPVTIPAANVTLSSGSSGAVTAISLNGVSLGTGWHGAGVVIGGGQGGGSASVVVTNGVPTAVNVVTGGNYGSKPTVVLFGTLLSGTTVTLQSDYQYVATTTPGTGPTEWASSVTFEVAQPQGTYNLGNPWLVAPDVRTRKGTAIPFDRTNPHAVDDGVLAMLTTPTGRSIGALRPMDAFGGYGGPTNYVNPQDLLDGSRLNWNTTRTATVNFTYARALNTDPNSSTYAWSSTKVYGPQAWAVQGPDTPLTITGTLTSGSTLVTNVSNMGLMVASAISGAGIPAGTTIAAVNQVFTATAASGSPVLAVNGGTASLAVGMTVASQYLPTGVTIRSVDGPNQVTLTGNATSSGYIRVTATGQQFTLSAPATASGATTLTVTSPGYIALSPSNMGSFLASTVQYGAIELRSPVPHGLSSGYNPPVLGTTAVPFVGGSNFVPGTVAGYVVTTWVTGPYTIAFVVYLGNAGNGPIQAVNSTTELTVDWKVSLSTPLAPNCLSYEAAADMCRQLGCGLWLNLPQGASDACLKAIAAKVAAHIGPTVPVHLEHGNELFTFPNMGSYFWPVQNFINGLPAGTAVLGGTATTIASTGSSVSATGSFNLCAGAAMDVFEAAWAAAGMDTARLHRHVSGQFGNPSYALGGLKVAQRAGRRVDHVHGAPYVFLPADAPVAQAIAPAGSAFAAAGSLPADAINALNLYYITYSQGFWVEWANESAQCQAFGQPLEQVQNAGTTPGSTGLAPGTYSFCYTFVDGQGRETTVGLSPLGGFTVSAGNIPSVTMPYWPSWAQALNWYAGPGTAPGVCTFYQQVTRAQYNSTYPAGSAFPFTAPLPAGYTPPPSTNQAAANTPVVPTLTCYEGSIQNPVSAIVPAYLHLLHDIFLHPSAGDLFRGFELMQQRGNPTVPGSGVVLACYFELFNPTQYPNMWFIAKGTSQLPGDGLGHAYAGSSSYTVAPNRYATIQGGYSLDGFAPDGHDHFEYGTSPMLQALRDWSDVASPMPVRPSAPQVVRTRRWFAGLGRSNARSGR